MEKKKAETGELKMCEDSQCPVHGLLSTRGRRFTGKVISKFPRRITISFTRTIYIPKYERYTKKKTTIHARISKCMENSIEVGEYVEVRECRPLSKLIHFAVINKITRGRK